MQQERLTVHGKRIATYFRNNLDFRYNLIVSAKRSSKLKQVVVIAVEAPEK